MSLCVKSSILSFDVDSVAAQRFNDSAGRKVIVTAKPRSLACVSIDRERRAEDEVYMARGSKKQRSEHFG